MPFYRHDGAGVQQTEETGMSRKNTEELRRLRERKAASRQLCIEAQAKARARMERLGLDLDGNPVKKGQPGT